MQRATAAKNPERVIKTAPARPVGGAGLRRKCACGGVAGPSGECESCRSQRLQRKTAAPEAGPQGLAAAPPIVQEVLRSPGQPLEAPTRSFFETRFGHDFSQVRVHTDAKAADSTLAVNALAYTVGRDVVFSTGRFAPGKGEGRNLLAHELAHVVQQRPGGGPMTGGDATLLEAEADGAAKQLAQGATAISVRGRVGLGLARAPRSPRDVSADDEEEEGKKRNSQATMTTVTQRPKAAKPPLDPPVHDVTDPNKAKGTRGEVSVPFDRYPGWDWNNIGGGGETASSRTNLARRASHDTRMGKEGSAGLDFLVENVRTGRLVIGEQKATGDKAFSDTTAITTSLETNLRHTVETLQSRIENGTVNEPTEVARLQKTIKRLKATQTALENGRAGKPAELPPGVVFELTNLGGGGEQIGREHLDLLAKKYGKNPAFMEHLLSRTFVRDSALAKSKGRNPRGQRGTDADPDIVPATEILTEPAREELARRRAGKTEREWKADKADLKKAAELAQRKTREAARQAQANQRAEAERAARDHARGLGEKARQNRLKQLHDDRAQKNEPEPRTKKQRDAANKRLETDAKKAGKRAEQDEVARFLAERKDQEAAARARIKVEENARTQKRKAEQSARAQHDLHKKALADAQKNHKQLAASLNKQENAEQTQAWHDYAKKSNADAAAHNRRTARDQKMSKAAHLANQAAAGVRAFDAYDDARAQGKGRVESALDAGKTYLDNTNPILGVLNTVQQRMQKDASGKQYYGTDAVDAWLGTLGETGAGYAVPGGGVDQLVNATANVAAAVDDHLQKGRDPNDPAANKANLRTVTDLAADVTPSRMAAQTLGGGLRAYYDLAQAATGDTRHVDKFADDAVHGKMGSVLQPWAMVADFVGNLASDSAGVALNKTIKKTEGTTLKKLGDASGDAMYNLGQSKEAKSAKYGTSVQGIAMTLGMTSDLIAGKSFDKALNDAADAGKGSLADTVGSAIGDTAFTAVEKGKEIVNEDLPAAKKKVEAKIDQMKKRVSSWWNNL
jgi:Domain of unknown function (DUF4157)